jgi:antitoxin HicB
MKRAKHPAKSETDYPVKIEFDRADKVFTADFFDLPGCSATGSTVEEAYDAVQRAKEEWLRLTEEQGLPIPKPSTTESSGRMLLRLPSSLHGMLSAKARLNGTSLNQYLVHLLSAALVWDDASSKLSELTTQFGTFDLRLARMTNELSLLATRPSWTTTVYQDVSPGYLNQSPILSQDNLQLTQ